MQETLTFAVFAAGFVVRPLGGIIFGNIGDRFGRRSYKTIGIAAPIILTIIRLIQGFSLGGEFSGCISYIVEHASFEQRGLAGSSSCVSMCGGMLLGLGTAAGFSYFMPADILFEWGWRIPFIAGLFISSVGLYIRKNLAESPIYKKAKGTRR
ncbi:proline/betaine transporter-like protein [Rickettsia conorii str. Malish 7]|uniref:Proline/betaine transporter-like protein n=1 Tax=Rickettsia conorii (strain ATCC VR-613 / Malish 7) TaxID=272944 RepID=Q92G05_RICCN|nr:proline/betaine transporter-like protein [Rickettsia conorii str. Malish 7]